MKIDRFKLYEVDKFEMPNNSIFFDIAKKQKELISLERRADNIIKDWLKTDFNYFKNKYFSHVKESYEEYVKFLGYTLHPWNNGSSIEYVFEIKTPSSHWALDKPDFDDLMSYIYDPESYNGKKEYNL